MSFPRSIPCLLLLAAAALWGAAPAAAAAADGPPVLRPAHFFLPRYHEGPWLAPDRQLHFAGSLAIAASLRVEGRPRAESVAGSFAIGVAKEIYDAALKPSRLGRGASRKDLVADLAGALAGVLLIAAIDH